MPQKMFGRLLIAICLSFTFSGPAMAEEPTHKTIDFSDYALKVVDYTLPNGLRVLLAEDHSAPVVAVDIWYHVGGANDPPGRSGFAHLFEHLMFEGSAHVPEGDFDILLEAVGAENNAYTAEDQTAYYIKAPAHQLPLALWLESDRMAALAITDTAFEAQRSVVIEEFNESVANAPHGVSDERLYTLAAQGYLPYDRPVIG
ncbi:MAG: insulinase family protein, partial [Chloroflexi bacterium]|nr:insulinase family protein [Chloroflexota bacterium]